MSYSELDLLVLKAIITNKSQALSFVSECSANLFSDDLWNFATYIIGYIKTYREVPTLDILVERATKTNSAFVDIIKGFWKKIEAVKYNEKEFVYNVDKLKHRYSKNEIIKLKDALNKVDNGDIENDKWLGNIEKSVNNIKSIKGKKIFQRQTLKDSVDIFKEKINAKLLDPGFDSGILTGYSFLDNATDGFRGGELCIVGGETGAGKSVVLSNLGVQIWMQGNTLSQTSNFMKGYNVLYFSLEMPLEDCRDRIYSRLSQVPIKTLRRPIDRKGKVVITNEDKEKINMATRFMKNYPYNFELVDIPRGATVEQIELIFEEAYLMYHPDVVIVDYLGLLEDDNKNEDDWLKMGLIAGKLSEFCRVHSIIGITAVQLNRAKTTSKDSEERVGPGRIGRSALILTHANIALQIENRPNEKAYPNMVVHIIKNRGGENMIKGNLIRNFACATLLDDSQENTDTELNNEFRNVDDISEKIELFDI